MLKCDTHNMSMPCEFLVTVLQWSVEPEGTGKQTTTNNKGKSLSVYVLLIFSDEYETLPWNYTGVQTGQWGCLAASPRSRYLPVEFSTT